MSIGSPHKTQKHVCMCVCIIYLTGKVSSLRFTLSSSGIVSHPKLRVQSKFPRVCVRADGTGFMNCRLSLLMTAILGLTTVVGS